MKDMFATVVVPHPVSPRLSPIDRPKSWLMRVAFHFSRRMFGAVIAPMRFIYTRSMPAFWVSLRIMRSEKRLSLPLETRLMIRYYTAHLNDCPFCADISLAHSQQAQVALAEWGEYLNYADSPRFSPAEKALLAYLEAVNTTRTAPDEVFAALREHYSDKEVVEITWLNATENYYNFMARPLGLQSDSLAFRDREGRGRP